jgi:hypothetical protein
VKLNTKTEKENILLEKIVMHFKLLMSPSNLFLIPIEYAGSGEMQEVIDEIKAFESQINY